MRAYARVYIPIILFLGIEGILYKKVPESLINTGFSRYPEIFLEQGICHFFRVFDPENTLKYPGIFELPLDFMIF